MSLTIEALRGRIVDVDSHVMLWPDTMAELLGPDMGGERWRRWAQRYQGRLGLSASPAERALARETARRDVLTTKGWVAFGAQDAVDRLEAMDLLGIRRQLVFDTGMQPAILADTPAARQAAGRYNDWALAWSADSAGRLVPGCVLNLTDVGQALAEAERVVDAGARAVALSCARPPAGLSPADPAWDPLWSMLAARQVTPVIHLGGQGLSDPRAPYPAFVDQRWGNADALRPRPLEGSDPGEAMGPFDFVNLYLGPQVFMTAMVMGGVFQRHSALRMGVIEFGASWVSHWVKKMDGAANAFAKRLGAVLDTKPSEYVRRHVRVTPFYGEKVGEFLQRDELVDVYCFSTDYPHPEGGVDPVSRFFPQVAPFGDEVVERFFITNGAELLPAL